jgi:murein DD-endopeptidase MepM/ murein hydrolase activator NlpD
MFKQFAIAVALIASFTAALAARGAPGDGASPPAPAADKFDPPFRLAWPLCATDASGFGYRVDPFTGRFAFHAGLDLRVAIGTPVRAPREGTVLAAELRGPYGNMIEIDHGAGVKTRYGHLDGFAVAAGDRVAAGAIIGRSGQSGRSNVPHLHFEVWYRDVVWDPRRFLEPQGACAPRE